MQSPFEIFRKSQQTWMAVILLLAMFGFVVAPAITDPSNMPPILTIVFLGSVFGIIGWITGIRSKKSSEWGLAGLLVGAAIGIGTNLVTGPQDVVRADTGNIDEGQLEMLFRQRDIANQFVNNAIQRAAQNGASVSRVPQAFTFGHPDQTRDVIVGELLCREADRIGLEVSDAAVNDFIRGITKEKLGPTDIREIRDRLQISESELYRHLRQELRAQKVAGFLYGDPTRPPGTYERTMPPESYWEFYRQMNVQQSIGVVPISVDAFVDKTVDPPESELEELFAVHRANYPNTTDSGQLEEGRPGFRQPRRVQLAYVEIPYEAIEQTVGEVSDEDIEAYYEDYYQTIVAPETPSGKSGDSPLDAPLLPELTRPEPGSAEETATEPPANSEETQPSTSEDSSEPESAASVPGEGGPDRAGLAQRRPVVESRHASRR